MKRMLYGALFALLLFLLLPSPAVAATKGTINISTQWKNPQDFQEAVNAMAPFGGGINLIACPGDFPDLNKAIAETSGIENVKLFIRTSVGDKNFSDKKAQELIAALKIFKPKTKAYIFPVNEPNTPQEGITIAQAGEIRTFTLTVLNAVKSSDLKNKVYVISTTIDPFQIADSGAEWLTALGGRSYFSQFDGVSLSLYGEYEGAPPQLVSGPPEKNGSFVLSSKLMQNMVGNSKIFVETGVVTGTGGFNVVYGKETAGGRSGDDMIAEYLSLKAGLGAGAGGWSGDSQVAMVSVFNLDPDKKHRAAGMQNGWLYGSQTLGVLQNNFQAGAPAVEGAGGSVSGDENAVKAFGGCAFPEVGETVDVQCQPEEIRTKNLSTSVAYATAIKRTFGIPLQPFKPIGDKDATEIDYNFFEHASLSLSPNAFDIRPDPDDPTYDQPGNGKIPVKQDQNDMKVNVRSSIESSGNTIGSTETLDTSKNYLEYKNLRYNKKILGSIGSRNTINPSNTATGIEYDMTGPVEVLKPGQIVACAAASGTATDQDIYDAGGQNVYTGTNGVGEIVVSLGADVVGTIIEGLSNFLSGGQGRTLAEYWAQPWGISMQICYCNHISRGDEASHNAQVSNRGSLPSEINRQNATLTKNAEIPGQFTNPASGSTEEFINNYKDLNITKEETVDYVCSAIPPGATKFRQQQGCSGTLPGTTQNICSTANPNNITSTERGRWSGSTISDGLIALALKVSKYTCLPAEMLAAVIAAESAGSTYGISADGRTLTGTTTPLTGNPNERVYRQYWSLDAFQPTDPNSTYYIYGSGAYQFSQYETNAQISRYGPSITPCLQALGFNSTNPDTRQVGVSMCLAGAKMWRDGPGGGACDGKARTLADLSPEAILAKMNAFHGNAELTEKYEFFLNAYKDAVARVRGEMAACLNTAL